MASCTGLNLERYRSYDEVTSMNYRELNADFRDVNKAKSALQREVVQNMACRSVDDLDWDTAFDVVKSELPTDDWQTAADVTKKVLREIKSEEASKRAKEKHSNYLRSDMWKKRRRIKLQREGYTCEDCGCSASQAHHESYDNLAASEAEWEIEDLVALCEACHKRRHGFHRT